MPSEPVAESFVPLSAAVTVEAGRKRGRLPAGQVTVKFDADSRVCQWNDTSSQEDFSRTKKPYCK